jgi:hypothetical protein
VKIYPWCDLCYTLTVHHKSLGEREEKSTGKEEGEEETNLS